MYYRLLNVITNRYLTYGYNVTNLNSLKDQVIDYITLDTFNDISKEKKELGKISLGELLSSQNLFMESSPEQFPEELYSAEFALGTEHD